MDEQEVQEKFIALVAANDAESSTRARIRAASLYLDDFTINLHNEKVYQSELFALTTKNQEDNISIESLQAVEIAEEVTAAEKLPDELLRVEGFSDIELAEVRALMAKDAIQAIFSLTPHQANRAVKLSQRNLRHYSQQ